MRVTFLLFSLLILKSGVYSQVKVPNNFKETAIPSMGSDAWFTLNHSMNEFKVEIINGQLKAYKTKGANRGELDLPNGKLVSVDRGEWGGKLEFIPDDPSKDTVKIKLGNIKYIFLFRNKIHFLDGLAHGSFNKGSLFELDTSNNPFTCKKVVDFEDAPEAYAVHNNKLFIASHGSFYVLDDTGKHTIVKDTFWDGLYPNSVAIVNENNVFIGMRSGIVKLDVPAKSFVFYKYKK